MKTEKKPNQGLETLKKILNKLQRKYKLKLQNEYQFYPGRRWRFDFAFDKIKLAIEFEGGIFMGFRSGHTSMNSYKKDIEKYNTATVLGWYVLRYTAQHLYIPKTNNETKYSFKYVESQIDLVIKNLTGVNYGSAK